MNEEVRLRKKNLNLHLKLENNCYLNDQRSLPTISSLTLIKAFGECPFLNHIDSHEVNKLNNERNDRDGVCCCYNHKTVAGWKEKVCAHVTQKNSLIFARFSYCCANEYSKSPTTTTTKNIFHIFFPSHEISNFFFVQVRHDDESSPRGVWIFFHSFLFFLRTQWVVMSEEIYEKKNTTFVESWEFLWTRVLISTFQVLSLRVLQTFSFFFSLSFKSSYRVVARNNKENYKGN